MTFAAPQAFRSSRARARTSCVTCLLLLLSSAGVPQAGTPTGFEPLLSHLTAQINEWRRLADISITLTIFVGTLGLVIAATQSATARWVKVMVVILGVLVSSLTLVNNTIFRADHRAYQRLVERGATKFNQIMHEVDLFNMLKTDDEREKARARISKIVTEMDQLQADILAAEKVAANDLPKAWLVATAEAETSAAARPAWLNGKPPDDTQVYFVGIASNESLDQAVSESRDSAFAAAANDISVSLPDTKGIDREALAKFLAQGGHVLDTYSELEVSSKRYRVFTLLAVVKASIQTNAMIFGLGRQSQVSAQAVQAAVAVKPEPVSYTAKRQAVYEQLREAAQAQAKPEAVARYEEGRRARKGGQSDQAINSLKAAVELQPDFYLAWYNLALAYEETGRRELADSAYQRATSLEPQQKVRDASVYNAAGWNLLRERRFDQAQDLFQKALQLDPDHPKAKRNLEAAKARIAPE